MGSANSPPPGTNHGSSAVCLAGDRIVLVSRDGVRWEFPAGRPEGVETLLETLRREVREEACCDVQTAELLGFTTSRCLEGAERGLVLVRAHWAVRARSLAWQPLHEIAQKVELPIAAAMSALTVEPGLSPICEQIWVRALESFGWQPGLA